MIRPRTDGAGILARIVAFAVEAGCDADEVQVDVTGWFRSATDAEVQELGESRWGPNSFSADAIAQALALAHGRVAAIVRRPHTCVVDRDQALAWLSEHRPGQHALALCAEHDIGLVQMATPSVGHGRHLHEPVRWSWVAQAGLAAGLGFESREAAALNACRRLGLSSGSPLQACDDWGGFSAETESAEDTPVVHELRPHRTAA